MNKNKNINIRISENQLEQLKKIKEWYKETLNLDISQSNIIRQLIENKYDSINEKKPG